MSWQKYAKNKLSDPYELTVKLFQKCINNMRLTKEFLETGRDNEADMRLDNTYMILHELILSNPITLPELKDDVNHMYSVCIRSVEKIKQERNVSHCDSIISVVEDILEAYRGVKQKDEART